MASLFRKYFEALWKVYLPSTALGSLILVNQFGQTMQVFAPSWLNVSTLNSLWAINLHSTYLTYTHAALFLGGCALVVLLGLRRIEGAQRCFLQGVLVGLLAIPSLAAAGAAIYVIYRVALILWIPLAWIWKEILWPLLVLLAWPFKWLWGAFLKSVWEFLIWPFVWLAEHVFKPIFGWLAALLGPLFDVLAKYILKPLFVAICVLFVGLVGFLPAAITGRVVIETARGAVFEPVSPDLLFSQGAALGFLLFETAAFISMSVFGSTAGQPPISFVVLLALPGAFSIRMLFVEARRAPSTDPQPTLNRALTYWKNSKLEAVTACALVPVGIALAVLSEPDPD